MVIPNVIRMIEYNTNQIQIQGRFLFSLRSNYFTYFINIIDVNIDQEAEIKTTKLE